MFVPNLFYTLYLWYEAWSFARDKLIYKLEVFEFKSQTANSTIAIQISALKSVLETDSAYVGRNSHAKI